MHNLIELIKKEQKIYNIIFHELIRQSTVECSERGELLAEIRQKYSDLLSKVPRQIRGCVHNNNELYRFFSGVILSSFVNFALIYYDSQRFQIVVGTSFS